MMLALVLDVGRQIGDHRFAYREGAVSILPGEVAKMGKGLMNPSRAAALHELRNLCRRNCWRRAYQHVDVILDASRLERLQAVFPRDAAEIIPDSLLDIRPDPWLAVLGA